MFLELSKIGNYIVLSVDDAIIVAHLGSHRKEELAPLEKLYHNLYVFLDVPKHLLGSFCLVVTKII